MARAIARDITRAKVWGRVELWLGLLLWILLGLRFGPG